CDARRSACTVRCNPWVSIGSPAATGRAGPRPCAASVSAAAVPARIILLSMQLYLGELFDVACRVANRLGLDAGVGQHGHVQVGHRSLFLIRDVPAWPQAPVAASEERDRKILVGVPVAIAEAAAIHQQAVVE